MVYEKITDINRKLIHAFIKERWYTTVMIIRGKEIDMTKTEGFCCREKEAIIGLVTYIVYDDISVKIPYPYAMRLSLRGL